MKNTTDEEVVYSINVGDIQDVANQVLERRLTMKEILLVKESVGDFVDWFQSIESAIHKCIQE